MPTGVTHVAEEHFFFVKGTLTYLALCILGGGGCHGSLGGEVRAFSFFPSKSFLGGKYPTYSFSFLSHVQTHFFFSCQATQYNEKREHITWALQGLAARPGPEYALNSRTQSRLTSRQRVPD